MARPPAPVPLRRCRTTPAGPMIIIPPGRPGFRPTNCRPPLASRPPPGAPNNRSPGRPSRPLRPGPRTVTCRPRPRLRRSSARPSLTFRAMRPLLLTRPQPGAPRKPRATPRRPLRTPLLSLSAPIPRLSALIQLRPRRLLSSGLTPLRPPLTPPRSGPIRHRRSPVPAPTAHGRPPRPHLRPAPTGADVRPNSDALQGRSAPRGPALCVPNYQQRFFNKQFPIAYSKGLERFVAQEVAPALGLRRIPPL